MRLGLLILFAICALGFVIDGPQSANVLQTTLPWESSRMITKVSASQTNTTPTPTDSLQPVISATITIAPLASDRLMLRQKCFNDQGFQVDCATWTGYY